MMKAKKILLVALALSMLCSVTAFADTDTYDGYTKATVKVNGSELAVDGMPAIIFQGHTVLPLREMSDALHALVSWDDLGKVVDIYRPNVSMIFAQDVTKDYSIQKPFSRVEKGTDLKFNIFTQVDNLKTNVDGFRISLVDPEGNVTTLDEVPTSSPGEMFWYNSKVHVDFSEAGDYTVKFAFLYNGDYRVVAEKQIRSE